MNTCGMSVLKTCKSEPYVSCAIEEIVFGILSIEIMLNICITFPSIQTTLDALTFNPVNLMDKSSLLISHIIAMKWVWV